MKKWTIEKPDLNAAEEICRRSDLEPLVAKVLTVRGIKTVEEAAKFLKTEDFRSPYEIKDMKKAADFINKAVDENKKICIYGDYDCDGVTATVILYSYLYEIGADVSYYIPERSEGYGMNEDSIKKLCKQNINLIITVDNGITAINEAKLIKSLGMDLIVTDHHQVGDELPEAQAVVDVNQIDDTSFFKYFCGAGIAMKLIAAMEGGDYSLAMEQFGDLAALGTIGDVVSLTGENRKIVELGIEYIKNTERPGLLALRKGCLGQNSKITSTGLAFTYVPRINAAGRFGSPKMAAKLLLSEDYEEALKLFSDIEQCNATRKEEEERIITDIYNMISKNPKLVCKRVLTFYSKLSETTKTWHPGVIGIVASRIEERFGKPAYIITDVNGEARGSARAFGEYNVYESLKYCDSVLLKYGGHKSAGGFSLSSNDYETFDEKLQEYAKNSFEKMPIFTLNADLCIMPDDLTEKNIEGLRALEPFGEGNPVPEFAIVHAVISEKIGLSSGKHTKLKLNYGSKVIDAMLFRKAPENVNLNPGDLCDLIGQVEINEFNGKKSFQIIVHDYRKAGIKQASYFASYEAYEKLIYGENLPDNFKSALKPSRNEFIEVYNLISYEEKSLDEIFQKMNNISYGKFRIIIDAFVETGLVSVNVINNKVIRNKIRSKVDLNSTKILSLLK